jgi:hypothetical protein
MKFYVAAITFQFEFASNGIGHGLLAAHTPEYVQKTIDQINVVHAEQALPSLAVGPLVEIEVPLAED